jgi:hypothetical protein
MLRFIWGALILTPALKSISTIPEQPLPSTSTAITRSRAAAIAWAALAQLIFRLI